MIIATMKPLDELIRLISPYSRILAAGCHTCVTVGQVGGEENVNMTVAAIEMGMVMHGKQITVDVLRTPRQCEPEMVELLPGIMDETKRWDAILSFGCASGVQVLRDIAPETPVIPALNTRFIGAPTGIGVWENRCIGCGDCFLHLTGDVCVLARCPRGMQNGSCGYESESGMCDINPKQECVWDIIRGRFRGSSRQEGHFIPGRNWSLSASGGVIRVVNKRQMPLPEDPA